LRKIINAYLYRNKMYMKKIFLPILMLLGAFISQAQVCVPGTLTAPGSSYILPDSATNMIDACQGQFYEQIIYLKVPKDTAFSITTPINAIITADVDSFVISASITGLPNYLNVESVPAPLSPAPPNPKTNFTRLLVKGDSLACVRVFGNVPSNATAGTNPLLITIRAYLKNLASTNPLADGYITGNPPFGLGLTNRKVDTPVVLNDYRIIVKTSPCSPASATNMQANQFELVGAIPNPADNRTQIVFNSGKLDNYRLKIMNATGEIVAEKVIKSMLGLNYISIEATSWPKGTYMYSLTDGKHIYSNKLQLK